MAAQLRAKPTAALGGKPIPSPPRPFSSYLLLWTVANLLRIQVGFNTGTGLVGSTMDRGALALPLLVLAGGLVPARWPVPFAAMAVRALTNLAKGSFMSNSQMWATQMDAAVLLALAACVCRRPAGRARFLTPLSASEELEVVCACARTIRWQLALFYFASGWWKLNSSFLHPDYSCASLFMVQPLEYLPDSLLFAPADTAVGALVRLVARLIARTGPVMTLVIEAAVPALHALDPARWPRSALVGVAVTLVFHLIIGMTPPPSNVSSYGVTTVTRLFFAMPAPLTAAIGELRSSLAAGGAAARSSRRGLLLGSGMAAAAALALALVAPYHSVAPSTVQGDGVDWHLCYYAALCVLFGRGLVLGWGACGRCDDSAVVEGPPMRRLFGVAVVYAMVLPMIGLQEKAGCLMFSQLRLHGGSNHLLMPTALLPRALLHASPTNAFAGGVVRVEATDLRWVGNTFAEHMGPRTLRLVREVAAVPAEYVWAAKATSAPREKPPPRFLRHTLSNLGLRRLLATGVAQGDAFTLRFTRLPGAVGDEAWRVNATGAEYVVRSAGRKGGTGGTGSTGGAGGAAGGGDGSGGANGVAAIECARVTGAGAACLLGRCEVPCDEREAALLAPPGKLSSALAYFLVPQPNPIYPGRDEEMHCVTWG